MSREPPKGGRGTWWEAGLVFAIALPLLLLMDAYVRDSPTPRNDEQIYELMAQTPFGDHTYPFAHRVGVPALVHILPFSHTVSFSLLAWLSTAACGSLVYVLLRRFEIPKGLSLGLGVSLALCPTLFVVSLRQGRNVDPESVLMILAGAIAIVDRRPVVLGAIVLLGMFVREAALFLIPWAYAVWATRWWDPAALRKTLAMATPAILGYAALRLTVPSSYANRVVGYDSLLGGRIDVIKAAVTDTIPRIRRILLAYGPLWFVAPFALRDLAFARRGLVLVACCLVAMTFSLEWGRLIMFAAPVFFVAGGWVLRDRPRLAALTVAAFMAMNLGYVIYLEDFGGAQDGIVKQAPAAYPAK